MNSTRIYPVCVVGGGSAGVMSVLRTVLNNDECLFFPGSPKHKKKSRAMWVRKIENMPAHFNYTRGIEEPNVETLNWISNSVFKDKLIYKKNIGVDSIEKSEDGLFKIKDSKGELYFARFVILCTGVMDVQPEINQTISTVFDYANAQTIDYCLICDGHHVLNKKTVVLGHNTSAAWVSIMLYERYQTPAMTILTNGKKSQFDEETTKLIKLYKISVIEEEILEIIGSEKGKILRGFKFKLGQQIEADIAFVSLGMIVYNELAKSLGAEIDQRGFVKTNELGETNINGLYVAGDLRANTKKQIYTAWDNAVTSVNNINQKLRKLKREELLNR